MTVLRGDAQPDSTENWDDDFEFQQDGNATTRRSTTSTQRQNGQNMPLSKDHTNVLTHWAEPGPSTPTKRTQAPTENWDDDFQDKSDSPRHSTSPRSRRSRRRQTAENWDDEFESKADSPSGKSARWSSSSDEGEFGFADKEEDRTVTSRNRRPPVFPGDSPPPPVPPMPSLHRDHPEPFPRSPTVSVFSVPGSESVGYSSTAHLALRPTRSGSSFSVLPPSPPIHRERERRRLRKKSRPPRVDDNIYELDDRAESLPRPLTPPQEQTQPFIAPVVVDAPVVETSPTARASLVSRIGSVGKKFGAVRRKRVSTEPSEVALQEDSQSPPSNMPHSSSRWFFRHGGGGAGSPPAPSSPLKPEKSTSSLGNSEPATPSRRKQRQAESDLPEDLSKAVQNGEGSTILLGTPRRPTSMQVSSSEARVPRPAAPRHTSYQQTRQRSRSLSKNRSASASVDDLARPKTEEELPGTGSRLIDGMRRISLTGKHKRTKSSAPNALGTSEQEKRSGENPSPPVPTSIPALPNVPVPPPDRENDATPRPSTRTRPSYEQTRAPLLPPIELQPPSPPRVTPSSLQTSHSEPVTSNRGIDSLLHSHDVLPTPAPSPCRPKPSVSPQQSASLGRSAQPPKEKDVTGASVPRRNSLGDLKIPARISQAQSGLRRDLGLVREFATSVEQLKQLQSAYTSLLTEAQTLLATTAPSEPHPPRTLSPTIFNLPRPGSRSRSNTNPSSSSNASNQSLSHQQLALKYNSILSKYRISWECAELLIELGGGPPAPSGSTSPPAGTPRASRDRAVTLAGDEPRPDIVLPSSASSSVPHSNSGQAVNAPNSAWRASTGRSDLSSRQLFLLRGMITSDTSLYADIPEEEVNRHWKWGDAMSSTVTLPSEESSHPASSSCGRSSPMKKRRSHFGMRGLRDMLRSLKKSQSHVEQQPQLPRGAVSVPVQQSSTSVAVDTDSSLNLSSTEHARRTSARPQSLIQRRRAKTSTGPESMKSLREREYRHHPNSPYATTGPASLSHKSSPRRPSLASIFRLGQKHKTGSSSSGLGNSSHSNNVSVNASPHSVKKELHKSTEDVAPSSSGHGSALTHEDAEDGWDQMDSASDLEQASRALFGSGDPSSTVRGKKGKSPYTLFQQRRTPNASQSSIWGGAGGGESPKKTSSTSIVSPTSAQSPVSDRQSRRQSSASGKPKGRSAPSPSPRRPPSRSKRGGNALSGSVRSAQAPPQTWFSQKHGSSAELQDGPPSGASALSHSGSEGLNISLAMTPENIKPLLENAKEVHARCGECIAELRSLLSHAAPRSE